MQLAHGVLVVVEDDDVHGVVLPDSAVSGGAGAAAVASAASTTERKPAMSLTMHSASVPVFVRMLGNMLNWLDKAEAHAEARKFDSANYLGLRLAPDMLPFSRQIQIASDGAKGCVARLAGIEVPKWEDTEATLAELRARVRKTIDYVQTLRRRADRRQRGARDPAAHAPGRPAALHRRGLPEALRAAEFLLPRHHHLCAAAPRRRGTGQARLSRRGLTRRRGAGLAALRCGGRGGARLGRLDRQHDDDLLARLERRRARRPCSTAPPATR